MPDLGSSLLSVRTRRHFLIFVFSVQENILTRVNEPGRRSEGGSVKKCVNYLDFDNNCLRVLGKHAVAQSDATVLLCNSTEA